MRSIQKTAAALALGGLAMTAAACGGSSSGGADKDSKTADSAATGEASMSEASKSEGTAAASSGEAVKLQFFSFQSDKVIKPLVEAFEKANPNITVEVSYGADGGGGYAKTLQTRIAGKQTPDVFQIVSENTSEIVSNGIAMDLSKTDAVKGVQPSWLDIYRKGDEVYGVTFTAWMGGVLYNKDLFEKAGITEFPKDWDAFVADGQKLLDAGIEPYYEEQQIASGSLTSLLASSYEAAGVPSADWVLDARPKGQTFAEAWTPALTEWQKAVDAGVIPSKLVGLDGDGIKNAFMTGQVAMFRGGNWNAKDAETAGINYGFAPFPAFPGGKTYINGGGDPAYAISASSSPEKQAAATTFLNFIASAEGVQLLVEGQGAMSISSNYSSEPLPQFADAYTNNLLTGQKYWFEWSKGSTPMTAAIVAQQQEMLQGKATPESFAAALDTESGKL